jgi:hypothetical protein
VLALVVAGEPGAADRADSSLPECFPQALRFQIDADGRLTDRPAEPIAADARPNKDGTRDAILKVIAGTLGVGFDDLRRRELRRVRRRQFLRGGFVMASSAAGLAGYATLTDLGLDLPAGRPLRRALDRWKLSPFRRPKTIAEIGRAAAAIRKPLLGKIVGEWQNQRWLDEYPDRRVGPKKGQSVWITSQAVAGALSDPDAEPASLRSLLGAVDAAYAKGNPIEIGGTKYGWLTGSTNQPQAEPALWTIAALAIALRREGLIAKSDRQLHLSRLAYAQEVAEGYGPAAEGGWNIFAQQVNTHEHSTYTSTLALLALLETRASGLPWRGSDSRCNEILALTSAWLTSQFDARTTPPGWRFAPEVREGPVLDGLTLQIYSSLLRAEAEASLILPAPIAASIPYHLERLEQRDMDFPISRGSFLRSVYLLPEPGAETSSMQKPRDLLNMSIGTLWYPWGVDCAARWLRRLKMHGMPIEDQISTQRILGHLVVDLRSKVTNDALAKETYISSETLYGLSALSGLR